MTNILICTVGGSHQPIVSAIHDQRPDYVIFICTGNDPATGQQGSMSQITGQGAVHQGKFWRYQAYLAVDPHTSWLSTGTV